jgi:hypothetical protein
MQELAEAQARQFIPQVIMAGHDIAAMPRGEVKALALGAPHRKLGEAITVVAWHVLRAQDRAEEIVHR